MMSPNLSRLLGTTVMAGLFGAVLAGQASAQAVPVAPNTADVNDKNSVEEVIVTGTRIRRPDLTSAQPISVVTTQDLELRGITNIADAINHVPGAGAVGQFNPIGDQGSFSTGRNYISLYNLGSQRTLTLVNGRRFVPAQPASQFAGTAGGQVDLNSIPDAFVDNVQVLTGSGASIYGSDAVAGVVNVILKRNYEGLDIDAQGAGSIDHGDYPTYRFRATAGHNFLGDRANVAVSYEYNSTGQLLYTDRKRTAQQLFNAVNPANTSATDGIPATILRTDRRLPELNTTGVVFLSNATPTSLAALTATLPKNIINGVSTPLAFDASGNLVPYNIGQYYSTNNAVGGDGLNLAPLTSLQTPLERHLINAIGHFDLTPHATLRGELLIARVDASEPANQPVYNSTLFGGTSGAYAFNINNPFLSAQARTALQAAAPNQTTFFLNRASTDLVGNSQVDSQSDTIRGVITLEGDFNVLDRKLNYDVSANYGVAQGYFRNPGIVQEKFAYATDVVTNGAGQPACRVTVAGSTNANAQGCQPLNLFGSGNESAAALAYVTKPFENDYYQTQEDYQANLNGPIFQLPGGDVRFNLGYEYRREQARFRPDAASAAGIGRSVPISPAQGAFDTNEVYGEIHIPIFGPGFNFPLARSFEIGASGRHVENSLAGANNAHTYEALWRPIPDLLIRGSTARTFRAPALTELFLPTSSAFGTATDPCDFRNINIGPNPTARRANCLAAFTALGAAAALPTFNSKVQSATIPIITSGNPDLVNERARTKTYGFVYQPHYIPRLSIALDVTTISLRNAISSFTLSSILSTCYDANAPSALVCGRFARGPDGQIADNPMTGFVNAGFFNFEGQTLTVDYNFNLSSIPNVMENAGNFAIRARVFHEQRRDTSVAGTGLDIVRASGQIGDPRYTTQFTETYTNGPFAITAETRFQSESRFNNTFTVETQQFLKVRAYYVNDVSLSYKFFNRYTARLGVQNIFDAQPPFGTTGVGVYDLVGRYVFGGINAKF